MARLAPLLAAFLATLGSAAGAEGVPADPAPRAEDRIAEARLDDALAADPGRRDARLARAHLRAFRRDLAGARADYEAVLASAPRDVEALVGLGHALAWAGDHDAATARLEEVLAISPRQPDAAKGLAWVALWRGDAEEAARRFALAASVSPADPEPQVGLGDAHRRAGRTAAAREAYARALSLAPDRADARAGLEATSPASPALDATVLGGVSTWRGDGQAGLRFAEVGIRPAERLRLWLQYDGSLGLDNEALARRDAAAPAWYAGALAAWGEGHATRLEGGWRSVDGARQALLRAEQVLALRPGLLGKVGGWLGLPSGGRTEAVGHAAVSLPVTARLRLEPALFLARTATPGERDVRLLLSADLAAPRGIALGASLGAGRVGGAPALPGRDVVTTAARASFPLRGAARGELRASHERAGAGAAVTAFAAGLSLSR